MTAFNDRSASGDSPAQLALSKKYWLLALPALAVLGWAALTLVHHSAALHRVHGALQEFRSGVAEDTGPNKAMNSALIVRGQLVMHRVSTVSAAQEAMLLGILSGPADDMTQSEALDVLGIAKRMNALSVAQQKGVGAAVLKLLRRSPGPMVRLESARLLGHLENAAATPALLALQTDHDPKVQKAAGDALTQVKK